VRRDPGEERDRQAQVVDHAGGPGHAGLGERRHAVVGGARQPQDRQGADGARRLAQAHVQVEHGRKPQVREQRVVRGLGERWPASSRGCRSGSTATATAAAAEAMRPSHT
jgi:hypothetical protein